MEKFKGIVDFVSYNAEYHEYNIEIDGVAAICDPFIGHSERSKKLKGRKHIVGRWHGEGVARCLLVDSLTDVPVMEPSSTYYKLTAIDKAKSLYQKFHVIDFVTHHRAKKLAIITAEECLQAVSIALFEPAKTLIDNPNYQYWKEVISQIKKL